MTESTRELRTIHLRLHAMLRDAAGASVLEVQVPVEDATALGVFEAAARDHPALGDWTKVVAFAAGDDLISPRSRLEEDVRELDALPPVSGG